MTDVFVRVFSCNELRLGFAIAAVARWKLQKDVRITVLQWDEGISFNFDCETHLLQNSPELPFATQSLQWAERKSFSDPYIIANDDTLIYGQDFVQKGLKVMEDYPDYGVISGYVTNGGDWNTSQRVTEIHAVGGLVFLRKGLVTEFPSLEDAYWDIERHRQVTAKGFRSGYSADLPYLHMGQHFSVANPAFFVGA